MVIMLVIIMLMIIMIMRCGLAFVVILIIVIVVMVVIAMMRIVRSIIMDSGRMPGAGLALTFIETMGLVLMLSLIHI